MPYSHLRLAQTNISCDVKQFYIHSCSFSYITNPISGAHITNIFLSLTFVTEDFVYRCFHCSFSLSHSGFIDYLYFCAFNILVRLQLLLQVQFLFVFIVDISRKKTTPMIWHTIYSCAFSIQLRCIVYQFQYSLCKLYCFIVRFIKKKSLVGSLFCFLLNNCHLVITIIRTRNLN